MNKNHMTFIKKNLAFLRKHRGINQSELANDLGYTRDNIMSYERGTEPKIDFLLKVVNYFHISLDQIVSVDLQDSGYEEDQLYPNGEKFVTHDYLDQESLEIDFSHATDKRHDSQRIPLYNLEAAASLVSIFQSSKQNIIDFITIPNMPKCDGAISVTGDSMYPLLKSGDIVLYKILKDLIHGIFFGEMYLLSLDVDDEEMITVKFVQRSELGVDFIKLVSENRHHSPKDVPVNRIRAMALVKASIRINSMN